MHALLQAFITVFPAELPDKSMFATIVLVTRYRRPGWVWVGVVAAFLLHVIVAVLAGSLLSLLPEAVVLGGATAMFALGAVMLWRDGHKASNDFEGEDETPFVHPTVKATLLGAFGVIIVAEWGDLTQLVTASLAAKSGQPLLTGLGAWLALAAVAGLAALFGHRLVDRVPIHRISYVGAVIFALLTAWTAWELIGLR
ncbi:MAG: TMEM165/GDT1 family protein [Acidimicrobiales bacterium]